jgi:hypothetical protein
MFNANTCDPPNASHPWKNVVTPDVPHNCNGWL